MFRIFRRSEASPSCTTVDVQQAHERLQSDRQAQIVDVREPREWAATGVPKRAVLIPLGQLGRRAEAELAKDKPVYVICNSGNRSRTGSAILLKLGYTDVYNVAGGIQAWLRAGLPVERTR
jgi:rhodanese-related sulfurtransferase